MTENTKRRLREAIIEAFDGEDYPRWLFEKMGLTNEPKYHEHQLVDFHARGIITTKEVRERLGFSAEFEK